MPSDKTPNVPKTRHPRSIAAIICWKAIDHERPLDQLLARYIPEDLPAADRALIHNLTFGVIRWFWQLEEQANLLLQKPIRNKDRIVHHILLLGLYQIQHLQIAEHAAVSEAVRSCEKCGKNWAKKLINACLRGYLRNPQKLDPSACNYSHPKWMAQHIRSAWPDQAEHILAANNQPAPLCLRVNTRKTDRDSYLRTLREAKIAATADPYSEIGIRLDKSIPVYQLPNFDKGFVSVQDTASQLIAEMLPIGSGQRVLDACAAPGGKTALLLENCPESTIIHALDVSDQRNQRINENLQRLDLSAAVITGDATSPGDWWDGQAYDRILIDAPCSGLGVIRRHPDIKHQRSEKAIDNAVQLQASILEQSWNMLASDGLLLYTTCSIAPVENDQQIESFLNHTANARIVSIEHPNAVKVKYGMQTLPGVSDMDGFYYCLLQKVAE